MLSKVSNYGWICPHPRAHANKVVHAFRYTSEEFGNFSRVARKGLFAVWLSVDFLHRLSRDYILCHRLLRVRLRLVFALEGFIPAYDMCRSTAVSLYWSMTEVHSGSRVPWSEKATCVRVMILSPPTNAYRTVPTIPFREPLTRVPPKHCLHQLPPPHVHGHPAPVRPVPNRVRAAS